MKQIYLANFDTDTASSFIRAPGKVVGETKVHKCGLCQN
jgi:hypothetical protein